MPSGRAVRSLLVAGAMALVAGCMGADPEAVQLALSEGEGDVLVLMELEDGELVSGEASWVSEAAAPEPLLDTRVARWEVLVLKDDVGVDRLDVLGTTEHAFVIWRSSDIDARVTAGDLFTFFVVDRSTGDKIAHFRVEVTG